MAYVTDIHCKVCNQTKREVYCRSHPDICAHCWCVQLDRERRQYLSSFKGLTVEERLDRLEALLYDLNVQRRLEALEAEHERY